MSESWFAQAEARVRLGWGARGARHIPATYAVVIDVLCFSTTVSVAADAGSIVWPWPIPETGAHEFAAAHDAVVTVRRSAARHGRKLSLSPETWRRHEPPPRVVLPSGNGSTLSHSLSVSGRRVVAGCLRNRTAVAGWLADQLDADSDLSVTLVAAGEKWPRQGGLRPCLEDLLGAGAIVDALDRPGWCSDDALAAAAAFRGADAIGDVLRRCGSGKELIDRGYPSDVWIAAELDESASVPLLVDGAFVDQAGQPGVLRRMS